MYASKMNYKGKRKDLFRMLDNLKKLGLNVSSYEDILIDNIRKCEEEVKKEQTKPQNTFTDTVIDSIYAKYLKELRMLSSTINSNYSKLLKALEHSEALADNVRNGIITDANYAIYVNDVIRDMDFYVQGVNFLDPNVEIILQKLIPNYIPIIRKELLYSGHSIILSYLIKSGLNDIFKSVLNIDISLTLSDPSSLETILVTNDDFKKDIESTLKTKYASAQTKINKNKKLEAQIIADKKELDEAQKRYNNTHISRSIALLTALGVAFTGLFYFTNKGIKKLTTKELLATNTTTYSSITTREKSAISYEEKIPYGEKILVVTYAPWKKIDDAYEREITTFDVSNIDYDTLESYTLLSLSDLDKSITRETKDYLSARDLYKEEIIEVIRKIQNPNTVITEEDKVLYYTAWTIILFSLLLAYFIAKFSLLMAGINDGLVSILVKDLLNNLRIRRDSSRIIADMHKDIMNTTEKIIENNNDIDDIRVSFATIYNKYRYLLKDTELLEKYDNLVRRKN